MKCTAIFDGTPHNFLHRLLDDQLFAVGERHHGIRRLLNALDDFGIEYKLPFVLELNFVSMIMTGFPSVPLFSRS